jgi:hypothetical protein
MSRANLSDEALGRIPNTYLYVDEFQNFANESFAEILSESRKYKLCLTVANQYVDQMTEEVRNAVIGNVGTFIAFRVGSTDAELMEREFAPYFTAEDMVNLGFTQMYLKLMIDGIGSKPFSANSLPPIPKPGKSYVEDIVAYSRKYFAGEKEKVEAEIKKWTNRDFNLDLQKAKQPKKDFKEKPTQEKSYNQKIPTTPKVVEADSDEVDEFDSDLELVAKGLEELKQSDKKVAELKVAKEIKQIISEVEKEEKLLRKRDEARLRALNTQKQAHANKSFVDTKRGATFSKNAGEVADEIPEDVLRALLDMDKI